MKDIQYIISDLVYKKYSVTRIAQELLNRGYGIDDVKKALEDRKLKRKSRNRVIGAGLIIIGILANFYTESTYINNFFRFRFFSQADFMLFNERILKPTITLSMIFLGINLITKTSRVSKLVKSILLILLTIFILTIISYNSIPAIIFGGISILLVGFIELPQKIKSIDLQKIFLDYKDWDGTWGYIFILLGIVLVYSSEVSFEFIESGEKTYRASLGFIDHFILNVKPFFGILGLITSLLISINLKKFKITLYILMGLSILFVLLCLLHSEFQNLIYGCSIILITSAFILYKNRKKIS